MKLKMGVRWDDKLQNERILKAKKMGLVDYIEVNYPISAYESPEELEVSMYAHSANNALCSAFGLNYEVVEQVKNASEKFNSPWIGEHLAWLGASATGALGYVFNSIYNEDFFKITVQNINELKNIYQRPIALELGPQYSIRGTFVDEISFLTEVANETGCGVILDISHLIISNNNLKRNLNYGLEKLLDSNIVEVHISGIRKSESSHFWHDSHDILPDKLSLEILNQICIKSSSLKAITFEHSSGASEEDFLNGLSEIKKYAGEI